jgi:hypothetical protein
MKTIARCSIYEDRPDVCKVYPTAYHYMPEECTFTFPYGDERREGDCSCEEGACCALPREGGEPGGTPLMESAGGSACKHLIWEDVEEEPKEKIASGFTGHPLLQVIEGE